MLHLGSIGGTSIDVDFSFFLLIFLFGASTYDPQKGIAYSLIWAPVLFISVLLHELAHAGTIAAFGYGSSHVILGGMGGVTINERQAKPWQEMLISAAGPLASFAQAGICYVLLARFEIVNRDKFLVVLVPLLLIANFWWGIFNLLPIPPLDGGKAFRNLLRSLLRENLAFTIAVWTAIVVGIAVVIYAIKSHQYFLAAIIGWFTFTNLQQWQDYRHRGFPGD